jgi:hypothetical protein
MNSSLINLWKSVDLLSDNIGASLKPLPIANVSMESVKLPESDKTLPASVDTLSLSENVSVRIFCTLLETLSVISWLSVNVLLTAFDTMLCLCYQL